jgi:hypothetical protein
MKINLDFNHNFPTFVAHGRTNTRHNTSRYCFQITLKADSLTSTGDVHLVQIIDISEKTSTTFVYTKINIANNY